MNDGLMTQEELDALLKQHSQSTEPQDLDIDSYLTSLEQTLK